MTGPTRSSSSLRANGRAILATSAALIIVPIWAAVAPAILIGTIGVSVIAVAVYQAPRRAAYIYAACMPLVVGIDRGSFLPGVRINEALLGVLLATVLLKFYVQAARGPVPRFTMNMLDLAVTALAVAGSIVPLASMALRSLPIEFLDVAYALVLPKLAATYLLVRLTVHRSRDVAWVLGLTTAVNLVVAALGILQAVGVAPVRTALSAYGNVEGGGTSNLVRASSTIGSPLAFADSMAVSAGLVVTWLFLSQRFRIASVFALAVFLAATLLSGQASAFIGIIIIALVIAVALRKYKAFIIGSIVALALGAPLLSVVLSERLSSIDPASGLPQGWAGDAGRWANLTNYIWPRFAEIGNVIFGVRLSAQIPSPYPWADWLYIESGYTWALWGGGVFLLAACIAFILVALRNAKRVGVLALTRPEGRRTSLLLSVVSLAAFAQLAVLMIFDPHLTYRGSGDLLFVLAAMVSAMVATRRGHVHSVVPHERMYSLVRTPSIR